MSASVWVWVWEPQQEANRLSTSPVAPDRCLYPSGSRAKCRGLSSRAFAEGLEAWATMEAEAGTQKRYR